MGYYGELTVVIEGALGPKREWGVRIEVNFGKSIQSVSVASK